MKCVWAGVNLYGFVTANTTSSLSAACIIRGLDNQLTPHLVVDVTLPGVQVPMEYARDGQIVLNIAPRAVGDLELANDVRCA